MFDDSGTLLFDDALPISRADCPILPDALATLLRSWLLRETHRLEPTPPPSDTPTAPAARADEPDSASSSESTAGAPAPPESTSAASENRAAPWREDVKGPARRLSLLIGAATDCHRFGPAAQLAFDTDLTSRLGITVQGRYEAPVGAYTTWSLGPMLRATFLAAEPFVLELLGGPVLVAHLAAPPRPDTYRWSLEMTARVRLRLGAGFQAIGGLTVAADPHPTLGRPRWLPLVGVAREIGS